MIFDEFGLEPVAQGRVVRGAVLLPERERVLGGGEGVFQMLPGRRQCGVATQVPSRAREERGTGWCPGTSGGCNELPRCRLVMNCWSPRGLLAWSR